jgi:hypothetical protein
LSRLVFRISLEIVLSFVRIERASLAKKQKKRDSTWSGTAHEGLLYRSTLYYPTVIPNSSVRPSTDPLEVELRTVEKENREHCPHVLALSLLPARSNHNRKIPSAQRTFVSLESSTAPAL